MSKDVQPVPAVATIKAAQTPATVTKPLNAAQMFAGLFGWTAVNPFASDSPSGPATPASMLELTWAASRRNTAVAKNTTTSQTLTTSQTFTTLAATANSDPQVQSVTVGTPGATDGVVLGSVNATDADGDSLSYSVTTTPPKGSVSMTGNQFTYTPTYAARHAAAATTATTADKQDTFTVTVTDGHGGQTTTAVTVSLVSTTAPVAGTTGVGNSPIGVAFSPDGSRAYVANYGSNTISVINTATNTVTTTITVGVQPIDVTVTPDGTRAYVANYGSNTVSVINTATNTVTTTITVGTHPQRVALDATGTRLYATNYGSNTVSVIDTATNTVTTTVAVGRQPYAIAVVGTRAYITNTSDNTISVLDTTTNTVTATFTTGTGTTFRGVAPIGITASPDGTRLYVANYGSNTVTVVDTATRTTTAIISVANLPYRLALTPDGTRLFVTSLGSNSPTGTVTVIDTTTNTPIATLPNNTWSWGAAVAPDGTYTYLTNTNTNTITKIANTSTANQNPTATTTIGTPAAADGSVNVAVNATDPDTDTLSYAVSTPPGKGSITMTGPGQFTYTPTYAARHAAAATTATTADKQDTFTVTVTDGHGGQTTTAVTVTIGSTNTAPTATTNVGTPNATTGVVTGSVNGTDADADTLTYSGTTTTTKGSVTVNANGTFTYTPTATARHNASATTATAADKQDTFTVTVNDGHGGQISTSVTVTIGPANTAPTGTAIAGLPDNTTGVVTGTVIALDLDFDPLTYTGATTTKGSVTVNSSGSFTYTPTAAARHAASATNATTADKQDTFNITVSDGHGGTTAVPVTVTISPTNVAPTIPNQTVGVRTPITGAEFYQVVGTDADADTLTYTVTTQAAHGTIANSGGGILTYTPNAAYYSGMTSGSDTFTITVTDGHGGTVNQMLTYNWSPLTTPTNTINTSNTTVGFADSGLYFMSQADINKTLDQMQAMGVNNVRIMIPWAGVEAAKDVYTWTAVDNVVNAAYARHMGVLGILNSTPDWAATPGQPTYAGAPTDIAQYAEFAGLVAARYAGKVTAYEIYNEPNTSAFWAPTPDAAAYTAVLKAGYTAIKAADPNATVLGGVLISIATWPPYYVNPVDYLQQMYDAGAAGYFDALSFHPYHYTLPFSQGGPYGNLSAINQMALMHQIMVNNGDGNKLIWSTEYGEPTAVASEATQAAYIQDYLTSWSQISYAGPSFIYTTRDTATNSGWVDYTFGVLRDDWTLKQSAYTMALWAATHPQLASVTVLT